MGEASRGMLYAHEALKLFAARYGPMADRGFQAPQHTILISLCALRRMAESRNAYFADIYLIASNQSGIGDNDLERSVALRASELRYSGRNVGDKRQAKKAVWHDFARDVCLCPVRGGEPLSDASRMAVASALFMFPKDWVGIKASTIEKEYQGSIAARADDPHPLYSQKLAGELRNTIDAEEWSPPDDMKGTRR